MEGGGTENRLGIGVRVFWGRWLEVGNAHTGDKLGAETYKAVEMRRCWVHCAIYYVCTRL